MRDFVVILSKSTINKCVVREEVGVFPNGEREEAMDRGNARHEVALVVLNRLEHKLEGDISRRKGVPAKEMGTIINKHLFYKKFVNKGA